MQRHIQKLTDAVINQIAAGEVVENAASVVKELVENSLDAGSKKIDIHLKKGGFEMIRIEDDGCGMGPEDALFCLERHATSKIRDGEDLLCLQTMGFRGEALAAIASISYLEIKTATENEGTRVYSEGGRIDLVEPVARNRGTSVEVKSLFYNVPARKKFQKSVSASTAQVNRMVRLLALARPDVFFSFFADGDCVLEAIPQTKKERVEMLLGALPHELAGDGIWGLLGAPQEAKAHRRGQYFYVNGRPIFSPLVSRAVKEGYSTRLKENEHPSFFLFLEIPPDEVDINVHPQKKEARFLNESELFDRIRRNVASAFEGGSSPLFTEPLCFDPPAPSWRFAETPSSSLPERLDAVSMPFVFPERPLALFESYLLLEKEGWILVDLQAAQARISFEADGSIDRSSSFSLSGAMEIWKKLQSCRDRLYDPLGRVIWRELKEEDLERLLKK